MPVLLVLTVIPVLIDLPPTTVGAQDTVLPVVLSAPTLVTRDKNRPRRYAEHDEQIRHDRRAWHDRQGRRFGSGSVESPFAERKTTHLRLTHDRLVDPWRRVVSPAV